MATHYSVPQDSVDVTSQETWAALLDFEQKCTMSIIGLEKSKLLALGLEESKVDTVLSGDLWKFLLLSMSEQHADGVSVTSVHSEGMCVYGTGPVPIHIDMQLAFRSDKLTDDHVSFLWVYTNLLRGSRLHKLKAELLIWAEDTYFFLHPSSIQMSDSSESPDYKIIIMQGFGYRYGVAKLRGYVGE